MSRPETEFVYVIPLEKYVYRRNDRWAVHEPVGKHGITAHLLAEGWDKDEIKSTLKAHSYPKVYGAEIAPNAPTIYRSPLDGKLYVNTWVPPELEAEPGEYPRIERILNFLCSNDTGAVEWVCNWMALKIQDPAIVPKVAAVFTTQPAGGKGTLAKLMRLMLGPENCDVIENGALANRFNAKWAQKLFVLADEVLTSDSLKDVSNRLKVLIDGEFIELEGKGTNQRSIRNRLAWMFASNDDVSPVVVEAGDRRYAVFSNHGHVPDDYRSMLEDCWEPDKSTPTPSFLAEIKAFYHDLLHLQVDRRMAARPYRNESREALMDASRPGHQMFFTRVDEDGIDDLVERVVLHADFSLQKSRHEWDFGDQGLATSMIYQCYVKFCDDEGMKALRSNKFTVAARKWGWEYARLGEKRTRCLVVRRTPGGVVPPGPKAFPQAEASA